MAQADCSGIRWKTTRNRYSSVMSIVPKLSATGHMPVFYRPVIYNTSNGILHSKQFIWQYILVGVCSVCSIFSNSTKLPWSATYILGLVTTRDISPIITSVHHSIHSIQPTITPYSTANSFFLFLLPISIAP